jgi:hypothetical protein
MTQKPEDDAGVGEEFYSAPAKNNRFRVLILNLKR